MNEIQISRTTPERSQKSSFIPLSLFQCVKCASSLTTQGSELTCTHCRASFKFTQAKFPNFLNEKDVSDLKAETEFWEQHYGNQIYQDESESSYAMWASWMATKPTDSILEIGCGSGALLTRLPAKTKVGLEPVEGLLVKTTGFTGVIGVATKMPFKDESFDVVYFKHSLHHVQDKWNGFKEALRVTKSGGKLIIIEPNADHPQRRLISNPHSLFRKMKAIVKFIGPVEYFQTTGELCSWAKKCGVRVTQVKFTESQYDSLSTRQKLQRIYRKVGEALLMPKRFLYPNYYLEIRK